MSFLPALTRRMCAWPLLRNSLLMIAISRQVSVTDVLAADLLRRQLGRTLAAGFGAPDQRHDPARQWRLQLFHQSVLLITNDSGPAHFASLTPIKSITLFGPETPVLYGPLGPDAVHLFAKLACSPCLSAMAVMTPCR